MGLHKPGITWRSAINLVARRTMIHQLKIAQAQAGGFMVYFSAIQALTTVVLGAVAVYIAWEFIGASRVISCCRSPLLFFGQGNFK